MRLYTALIDYGDGVNTYVDTTKRSLDEQIYNYVSDWWDHELSDFIRPEDRPKSHKKMIERYFELVDKESLVYDMAELPVKVKIDVVGGVAYVVENKAGVEVEIKDYDNTDST